MKIDDWYKIAEKGTRGDMVYDILSDWKKDLYAGHKLCEIYFNIASDLIGEEMVRIKRDEIINQITNQLSRP